MTYQRVESVKAEMRDVVSYLNLVRMYSCDVVMNILTNDRITITVRWLQKPGV